MIVPVKHTNIFLVFPEGYERLKAKNLAMQWKNSKDGFDFYRKVTPNADCVVMVNKIDKDTAYDLYELKERIDGIHRDLTENQGIIEAKNGVTERGIHYIYSIVRSIGNEEDPFGGATYILSSYLELNDEYAQIRGEFMEYGTTGMREVMGMELARRANLISTNENNTEAGWREDPYDSNYTRGIPMNLSEREGLDGLMPDHPLSQAREFMHAILCDELMLSPDNKDENEDESTKPDKDTTIDENESEKMSEEELLKWMLSKDVQRRFIPLKIDVELELKEKTDPKVKLQKIMNDSSSSVSNGIERVKRVAMAAKDGILEVTEDACEKGKEAQIAALKFVDRKRNARFLEAKLSAFEDGMKAGKIEAVDYIRKYADFCLASTAISYYFARCDGSIDDSEMLEIEYDLDSIIKNRDMPDALKNKIAEISNNKDLSFDEVRKYLDAVGLDTLNEFSKDIDEIIMADEAINDSEENAKAQFEEYLNRRRENKQK